LYDLPEAGSFFFKGGTSLSKAFNVIQRFSEDIDLIIDRARFGYTGPGDIASAPSKTAASKRMDQLAAEISAYIASHIVPQLAQRFGAILTERFSLEPDLAVPTQIIFAYPSESTDAYILPRVLVETGGNADCWPTEARSITPYVADAAPEGFADVGVVVTAVSATRTFWEKLTILHKTAHRFDGVPGWHPAARYSRHYYDVYRLARSTFAQSAIADVNLAQAVRDAANTFFPDNKANYDKFIPGSIRLVPASAAIPALAEDYRAMRDMIFGEIPSFDAIMTELRGLEERLNGQARAAG
jgi:Nucleotidyl transferase AbiEii toxin, Type IV TA system